MKRILMAALLPAFLLGCSDDTPTTPKKTEVNTSAQDNAITVTDSSGQPLANAQILIGDAVNSPFQGNLLTTDATGKVADPAAWTTPLAVTVTAPGFVRVTYIDQTPGAVSFKLRRQNSVNQFELRGASTGLPIQNGDGNIDFGLVMPTFAKIDLLTFNMDEVISPQTDRITVIGQNLDLPSNISLPNQSEKYLFFNININKPTYRIYFGQSGANRVFAARGRFAFKPVVDGLRGGAEFYELINQFKITGGVMRDVNLLSPSTSLDLPMTEMNFTDQKNVTAPAVNGDETFMAIGLAQQSGALIPTDVKNIAANQKGTLTTLAGADQFALGVLKKSDDLKNGGDRLSATLVPFAAQTALKVLPLIPDPTLASADEIILPAVNSIDGVNAIATYSVLSQQVEVQQGGVPVKVMIPEWEIYAHNWVGSIKLPQLPARSAASAKNRWEVNLIGSQTASQATLGPDMIEAATHVTHSSISY